MKRLVEIIVIALLALPICGFANTDEQSLGDVARKARAQKQSQAKATRVFDNDNIPKEGGISTVTMAGPSSTEKGKEPASKEAKGKGDKEKKTSADEEKEWREKFAKLREELGYQERNLDVLQRELNLSQIQNYSDPNVAMREEYQRTEINKKTQDIEDQKQKVDKLKKALADLEEELHRKGLPSGWAQ